DAEVVHELDPQDYHDFQVTRPHVATEPDGTRTLSWPSTAISVATTPIAGRRIVLVQGIEPSFRWRDYCEEILDVTRGLGVGTVVTLDRKSTRLNSSHVKISYAVFCLKKKKRKQTYYTTVL